MRRFLGLLGLIILLVAACDEDDGLTTAPKDPVVNDTTDSVVVVPPPVNWCVQTGCWDESIFACRDSAMIANFTRDDEGWTGGDATYSIALDEERTLWLFGDSFIGGVNDERRRTSMRLINNSLMLQEGSTFTTIQGGTSASPSPYLVPPEPGTWYWPGHGTVEGDTLYLFMHAFGTTGGMWGFFRAGVDLYKIDPSSFEVHEFERLIDGNGVSYGAHVMKDDDYTYVYGVLANNPSKFLYVARTSHDYSQPLEYYGNGEWSLDSANAGPLFNDVSEQFTVFEHKSKYYLLTQHHIFGSQIYLYSSDSPVGPWDNKKAVYCTPESGGDIFTYNAYAHTQFMDEGKLLISYNINSFEFQDLRDADLYRPYFVTIEDWEDD